MQFFLQEINYGKYINISERTFGIIEFTLIIKEEGKFVFTFFEDEDCYETNEKAIGNWHQKKDTLYFSSKKNNSNFNFNFNETKAIMLDANNVKIIKSKIP